MERPEVRNFSIIAHIDHGKSTLADRLLEFTHTVEKRQMMDQILDDMDLERERGITIKAHPVTIQYNAKDGKTYTLNIIDTPGHVDFTYEVSRSLKACEGALLIVDAAQGVEAQTVANIHLAQSQNLTIIPILNKIDLPSANPDLVKKQIEDVLCIEAEEAILASAKLGIGTEEILEAILSKIPPPKNVDAPETRALIFDSVYNTYRGVVVYVRLFGGELKKNQKIKMMTTGKIFEVLEVGIFKPKETPVPKLVAGDVGYFVANIKVPGDIRIGDTVTDAKKPAKEPLPGFQDVKPMVFSGFYPISSSDYELLKTAMEKLKLNDSSFFYELDSSVALGFGFRCGFLGLLHMEIVQERLEREYDISIIATAPSVIYKVRLSDGTLVDLDNPTHYPDPSLIEEIKEPFIKAFIIAPGDCIGALMNLAMDRRGECTHTETLDATRVMLTFEIPLNEILTDFYDKLKSITHGYGSLDYEFLEFRPSDMVKLDILINNESVDAFSTIVHRSKAESKGRVLATRLKEVIPKQMFTVPIQAVIGGKIVARETIRAMSKNVTAKCYGGDITRKRKLWEKQKAGKKRMKQVGKVQIPQSAFMEVLKSD